MNIPLIYNGAPTENDTCRCSPEFVRVCGDCEEQVCDCFEHECQPGGECSQQ